VSAGSTTSTAVTSIMAVPVRYRCPATTWHRRHRRNATVIEPSSTPSRSRRSNNTTTKLSRRQRAQRSRKTYRRRRNPAATSSRTISRLDTTVAPNHTATRNRGSITS
jgi:hypothetical protein